VSVCSRFTLIHCLGRFECNVRWAGYNLHQSSWADRVHGSTQTTSNWQFRSRESDWMLLGQDQRNCSGWKQIAASSHFL
jgi:hypothetical protein